MYAIVELGAKQYSVEKDDVIEVEKLDLEKGKELILDKVLLISDGKSVEIGTPYLKEAKVKAEVLGALKGEKKLTYKYRRRKAYHRKIGHRQKLTVLKIKEIHLK